VQALQRTIILLPSLLLANLLVGLIQIAGFLMLIIPALYAIGRTMLATSVVVAENMRNPVVAVTRSFALTNGNGWRITAMFFLIVIFGLILTAAVSSVLGVVFALVLPSAVAAIGDALVESVLASGITLALILMVVATYRQLAAQPAGSISGM
jgi:hypothetical protein